MERQRKTPPAFRKAMAQSYQIKRRKSAKGQQRQISKWLDMVREAFKNSGYTTPSK